MPGQAHWWRGAVLAAPLLAGCADQRADVGDRLIGPPQPQAQQAAIPLDSPEERIGTRRPNLIDRSLVEAPELFDETATALWDGKPTLDGLWIAHPAARIALRVRMINPETGTMVDGALLPGAAPMAGREMLISAGAADALGLRPRVPAEIHLVALDREVAQVPVPAPYAPSPPAAAPGPGGMLAAAEDSKITAAQPAAGAPGGPAAEGRPTAPAATPVLAATAPAVASAAASAAPVAPGAPTGRAGPAYTPAVVQAAAPRGAAEPAMAAAGTADASAAPAAAGAPALTRPGAAVPTAPAGDSPANTRPAAAPTAPAARGVADPRPSAAPTVAGARAAPAPSPAVAETAATGTRASAPTPGTDGTAATAAIETGSAAPAAAAPAAAAAAEDDDDEGRTAIGDGRPYIQAGTFAEPGRAADLVRTLEQLGIPARNLPSVVEGVTYGRVVAGPFPDEEARARALRRIEALGITDAVPARG